MGSLDESVTSVGRNFASKKKELLHNRRTAANLDQAIDTLQACLRVLDVVKRVRDMIKEGKYWSALRVCLTCVFESLFVSEQSLILTLVDEVYR